jgi:transglutaminase-like putative cysteine protease
LLLALASGAAAAVASSDRATANGAELVDTATVHDVIARIDRGDFRGAETRIAAALAATTPAERRALAFQRERMRRIRLDFTLDAAAAQAQVRKQIPDLTDAEFARWDEAGLLERMDIDGERRYFNRAPYNLFRLSAEARARRAQQTPFTGSPLEATHPHHRNVVRLAREQHATSVAPHRWRITQSLTVNADAVPAGEAIHAWIPYPRVIPGQQEAIHFVASEPALHRIAPTSALQRTAYFEKKAVAGTKTRFSVTYEVTTYARHFDVDPDKVVATPSTPALAPFLVERAPHVVFTDDMRAFSRRVVGDERNPWRIAQKLYAAVDAIPWAGAREYSTISNIGDYTLHAGHGDCGEQTLLLITLLRLNGIPARWQSGMMFFDDGSASHHYWNLHDWGQLYIAPYGWMPVDVTFGHLEDADPAVAGFYLGGLDAYRVAFNDDYGRPLVPAKRHFRSETVDLQRGEAEWRGGNLYFNQWDYDFDVRPLPPPTRGRHANPLQDTSPETGE